MTRHDLTDDATGATWIEIEGPRGTLRLERPAAQGTPGKAAAAPIDAGPAPSGVIAGSEGHVGARLRIYTR